MNFPGTAKERVLFLNWEAGGEGEDGTAGLEGMAGFESEIGLLVLSVGSNTDPPNRLVFLASCWRLCRRLILRRPTSPPSDVANLYFAIYYNSL